MPSVVLILFPSLRSSRLPVTFWSTSVPPGAGESCVPRERDASRFHLINKKPALFCGFREGGEPSKRRDYLHPDKQFLITRNGTILLLRLFSSLLFRRPPCIQSLSSWGPMLFFCLAECSVQGQWTQLHWTRDLRPTGD